MTYKNKLKKELTFNQSVLDRCVFNKKTYEIVLDALLDKLAFMKREIDFSGDLDLSDEEVKDLEAHYSEVELVAKRYERDINDYDNKITEYSLKIKEIQDKLKIVG